MRIATVSFDGGEYSVQLCSALAQFESTVKLFISRETVSPHTDSLDPSVELFVYERPRMRDVWKSLRFLVQTWQGIRDFQPDVVHIQHHHFWFYAVLLPIVARRYHTVITVHDPVHHSGDRESQKTPQGLVHRGYRRADDLIVHAAALKAQMVASLGFSADAIHVIPHIAVSNSNRASSHVAEDDATILFFGRIWEYKGLEYLIKAEPFIAEKIPQIKIIIAGKGEDSDRYSSMMTHPDRFLVHNEIIPWDDAARYFSKASVVVLPYTDASSSGVIPVAYSFAKPVVVSDVGGLSEMVEDGTTGVLVPPRDERAIADAVIRLVKDPALRRSMGARGREKLAQECGGEVVAKKTMKVYERRVR
jgi:glycosyltransferase involved in cell wall biosynthesis